MVATTAPSHVLPSLALFRELVRRGHRVTYSVGERLAGLVAEAGAEPRPFRSTLPERQGAGGNWPHDPVAGMAMFLEEGRATLPQVLGDLAGERPDLMLYDVNALAGPVAASRLGLPEAQLTPIFAAWEGYEDELTASRRITAGEELYRRFEGWLAENGVRRRPVDVLWRPERGLVLIPRALQPEVERVSSRFRFVGPCLDERRRDAAGWAFPAGDGPLAYVSFGTSYTQPADVFRACVEAFADQGWRVVLSVGHHVDPSELGPLPEGFAAHRSVPQLAVLAEAAAFVTHAGAGSAMEALWFAVPTVAIPQAVDQFANAARLEELGVGRQLAAGELTAARLRELVLGLAADGEVAARLARVSAEVRAAGGAGHAADAVEELML